MKNSIIKNKSISGISLLEALLYVSLFSLLISLYAVYKKDSTIDVAEYSIVNDVSKVIYAFDRRLTIDGFDADKWNKDIVNDEMNWDKTHLAKNFVNENFIASENPICGANSKWIPVINDDIPADLSTELGNYQSVFESISKINLLECDFWSSYPLRGMDTEFKIKTKNDSSKDVIESFSMFLNFGNSPNHSAVENWSAAVPTVFKLRDEILKGKLDTQVFKVELMYKNNADETISEGTCLGIKNDCKYEIKATPKSNLYNNDRLKVDSSNSMHTNVRFAFDSRNEEAITCSIWRSDDRFRWTKDEVSCGLTGGTDGDSKFLLAGNDLDADIVKLNVAEDCKEYIGNDPEELLTKDVACGIFDNGHIVINSKIINSEKAVIKKLITTDNINVNAFVKDKAIAESTDPLGRDVDSAIKPTTIKEKEIFGDSNIANRGTFADSAFAVNQNLEIEENGTILIGNALNLSDDSRVQTKFTNIKDQALMKNATIGSNSNGLNPKESIDVERESVLNKLNQTNAVSGSPNMVNNLTTISGKLESDNLNISNVLVATGKSKFENILAKQYINTEQLHFKSTLESGNNFNTSRSLSLDGLGPQFKYRSSGGMIEGWGAIGRFSTKGGLATRDVTASGNININMLQADINELKGTIHGDINTPTYGIYSLTPSGGWENFRMDTNNNFNLGRGQGNPPVMVGGVLFGDYAADKNKNYNNATVNSIVNKFSARKISHLRDNSVNEIGILRNYLASNNMSLIVPTSHVHIYNGLSIQNNAKRPILPNGGNKTLINVDRSGSNNKVEWITSGGKIGASNIPVSNLKSEDWRSSENLRHVRLINREYEELFKNNIGKAKKGEKGDRGNTGVKGDVGEQGDNGLDGIVGLRGGSAIEDNNDDDYNG